MPKSQKKPARRFPLVSLFHAEKPLVVFVDEEEASLDNFSSYLAAVRRGGIRHVLFVPRQHEDAILELLQVPGIRGAFEYITVAPLPPLLRRIKARMKARS